MMNIDEMKAGPELSALVAIEAMEWREAWEDRSGWTVLRYISPDGKNVHPDNLSAYSEDDAAAMIVADTLLDNGSEVQITLTDSVAFVAVKLPGADGWRDAVLSEQPRGKLPHAICLAALKAVGYEDAEE
jgi:hypothetical protein